MNANQRLTLSQIAALLSHALGNAVAQQAVDQAAETLRIVTKDCDRDDALRILELISKRPGVVGVTAQFAKSRLILWRGSSSSLAR